MISNQQPGRKVQRHAIRCGGPAAVRYLWDNLDMSFSLFKRFSLLSINFNKIIKDLSAASGINDDEAGAKVNRINWILQNNRNGAPGAEMQKSILEARHRIAFFNSLNYDSHNNKRFVTAEDLADSGFDEAAFLLTLRQVSVFAAWAYNLEIPQRIQELLKKDGGNPKDIPADELEIDEDDLAENKWHRFPFIILIDNSLSMGEGNSMEKLQHGLTNLFHEIFNNNDLSRSMELYVATCGGQPTEIVDFAMIDRQSLTLDSLLLHPRGACMMADTIQMALRQLDKRLKLLRAPNYDINFYKPWMLILSDGKFRGDMEAAIASIRAFPDLQVYARGVSAKARMDALRTLDSKATILNDFSVFFKNVFNSLERSQSSIPGGEDIQLIED